ncbi:hypothetical protein PoB_006966000 [Plakobranchus ocellatus]|uniref:Uncharacterized protein n=1 Tax=Plakobranchus ocellatus TaxID=259542 RepID=A0AAV4DGJ3_9GAST|nr:hypothetical protein PoB_006966000 [Plakobranchus ocellatus]
MLKALASYEHSLPLNFEPFQMSLQKHPSVLFTTVRDRVLEGDREWFEKTQTVFETNKNSVKEQARTLRRKSVQLSKLLTEEELEDFNLRKDTEKLEDHEEKLGQNLQVQQPGQQRYSTPSSGVKFSFVSSADTVARDKDVASPPPPPKPARTNTTSNRRTKLPSILSDKERDGPKTQPKTKASTRARPTEQGNPFAYMRGRHGSVSQDLSPPHSKFSQWTIKAQLTATDVAGVEWLDYNDGTYKEPSEDCSLVSDGATVIMIKKEFMLRYLRREW